MLTDQKLALGFAHWGNAKVTVQEMIEVVRVAVENGIYKIDCAPHDGNGAQENILGVALLCLPEHLRAHVCISTSIAHAAMQFVHMHPQVKKVVVGARTPQELTHSTTTRSA